MKSDGTQIREGMGTGRMATGHDSGRLREFERADTRLTLTIAGVMLLTAVIAATLVGEFVGDTVRNDTAKVATELVAAHLAGELPLEGRISDIRSEAMREALDHVAKEATRSDSIVALDLYDESGMPVFLSGSPDAARPDTEAVVTAVSENRVLLPKDGFGSYFTGLGRSDNVSYIPIADVSGAGIGALAVTLDRSAADSAVASIMGIIAITVTIAVIFEVLLLSVFVRRRSRELYGASEELRRLIGNAPVGIVSLDPFGTIETFNPKMVELSGARTAEELIGKNALELPSYIESGIAEKAREALKGTPFVYEGWYTSYSGGKRSYRRMQGIPIVDAVGGVQKVLVMTVDLTREKELEEELREQVRTVESRILERTEELALFIEASPVGIFTVTPDGKMDMVNKALVESVGAKGAKDLIGLDLYMLKNFQEAGFDAMLKKAFLGESFEAEGWYHSRSAKDTYFHYYGKPLMASDGKTVRKVLVIAQDLSARRLAEEDLARQKNYLQAVIDASPEGILGIDKEFRYTLWNTAMEAMSGKKRDAVLGKNAYAVFPFLTKDWTDMMIERVFKGEKVAVKDLRYEVPETGRVGWNEGHYSPIMDQDGRAIGAVALIRDTTEEKKEAMRRGMESAVSKAVAESKSPEEALPGILKAMVESLVWEWAGVWMVDPEGKELRFDKCHYSDKAKLAPFEEATRKLVFLPGSGLPGRVWESVSPMWISDLGEQDPAYFARAAEAKQAGLRAAIATPIVVRGKVVGVLELLTDERLEEDRNLMRQFGMVGDRVGQVIESMRQLRRVRELDELRQKFIQVVSHQLRTPLNSVRWNLEILLSEELGKLKVEQKRFIRMTHDADVMVIDRIHDLLTAMDIEEGRVLISFTEFSFESLWGSVSIGFKKACAAKDLKCTYVGPKMPTPPVSADAEKVREAMEKMLTNAVSYTKEKGEVTVSISSTAEAVRFEVSDTGIGIPEAERPRIMSRFYRATNASTMNPDASGLSLSIAKYYIEQHGGKMGFRSEEGKGSTFWFEIPINRGMGRE